MLASALDKVVIFAGAVFARKEKPQTLTKPWATPGDRLHLGISGQPEEPYTPNENAAKVFISSMMKQVLKSPNTSTMVHDLIKIYSLKNQNKSITILYHIEM